MLATQHGILGDTGLRPNSLVCARLCARALQAAAAAAPTLHKGEAVLCLLAGNIDGILQRAPVALWRLLFLSPSPV